MRYYVKRRKLGSVPVHTKKARDGSGRANDPSVLILTSLASGPKHGYALMQDIEAFAGVRLGPGTLYGAIGRLEGRGLIEALGPPGRRRPYRLSAAGAGGAGDDAGRMRAIVDEGAARLSRSPESGVALLGGFA